MNWNCPIYGSQINPKAKLYKRFTAELDVEIEPNKVITIEDNRYACRYNIAWVEADDMQHTDEQPLEGLPINAERMTIKFYGRWKPERGAKDEPETGDILDIDGELWIIEDGIQRARKKSLVNFATVYLPIRKLS